MGIFGRMSKVFKAIANNAVDSMENPELMAEQEVRELESAYNEATDAVAAMIAEEKRLEALLKKAENSYSDWEGKAKKALSQGKEDLAKEALVKRNEIKKSLDAYAEQLELQKDQVAVMRDQLNNLEEMISEAKRKKENIKAMNKTAIANEKVSDAFSKINKMTSTNTLDRMEEKVNTKYNKAQAKMELGNSTTEAKFSELAKLELDLELEKLKQEMGMSDKSSLDQQLQELKKEE